MTKVYHANGRRADHQTPPALLWCLQARWGVQFSLDVAAVKETAVAKAYYTPEVNGLIQPWAEDLPAGGSYFCNPPYGTRHKIEKWLAKGCQEARKGAHGLWLIPARVGVSWWWHYVKQWPHYFLPGRLTFWLDGRPLANSAGFPSAIVHMGPGMDRIDPEVMYWDWKGYFYNQTGQVKASQATFDGTSWQHVGKWAPEQMETVLAGETPASWLPGRA